MSCRYWPGFGRIWLLEGGHLWNGGNHQAVDGARSAHPAALPFRRSPGLSQKSLRFDRSQRHRRAAASSKPKVAHAVGRLVEQALFVATLGMLFAVQSAALAVLARG
jgi:hypothetical protein